MSPRAWAWALLAAQAVCSEAPLYLNKDAPIPERVADLLSRMTLDEKIQQLAALHGTQADQCVVSGSCKLMGHANVTVRNELQSRAINESRLGIPLNFLHEGNHGGCEGDTMFPMPLTMGASWNTTLVEAMYAVVGRSTRACGANIAFAPVINLFSDPRFGRFQEAFSPNPTLTAHMATASVAGLQGSADSNASDYLPSATETCIGLGKHFAAYGAAAGGLNGAQPLINERTLRDVYLKPWRAFAGAGGRGAMPSHNTVLGVPAHANDWLVNDVFRSELGFGAGITVSDCNDIGVLVDFQVAANLSQAAALGLRGGVDQDLQCGGPTAYNNETIKDALDAGLVEEKHIDAAASHVLTAKFASLLFETPLTDPSLQDDFDSPEQRFLALTAARQGLVLLKNQDETLPVKTKSGLNVAVIGQLADGGPSRNALLGSYVSDDGSLPVDSVLEAMQKAVGDDGQVTYVVGGDPDSTKVNQTGIDAAATAAAAADVAVLVLGDSTKVCGEWHDRSSLDLAGTQLQLLSAVTQATKSSSTRVVVVLLTGRPQTFGAADGNAVLDDVGAVLWAGRPGEEGARAIVDVILGKINPSGKTQASWPRSVGHVGSGSSPWRAPIVGKWVANSRGSKDADGRRYDNYEQDVNDPTPLFYFGFGLSYTTFKYSKLKVSLQSEGCRNGGPVVKASFTVTNTGSMTGQEISQLYVTDPIGASVVVRPWKRLAGFAKTRIEPGESAKVDILVGADDLALHGIDMKMEILAGTYTFSVGGASNTDDLNAAVTIGACAFPAEI